MRILDFFHFGEFLFDCITLGHLFGFLLEYGGLRVRMSLMLIRSVLFLASFLFVFAGCLELDRHLTGFFVCVCVCGWNIATRAHSHR